MSRKVVAMLSALTLCLPAVGCLTQMTYDEFDHMPIAAAWAELKQATPSRVQMLVRTEYDGGLPKQNEIEFNPQLEECESIRVFLRTEASGEFLTPGVRVSMAGFDSEEEPASEIENRPEQNQPVGECVVTILITEYADDLNITAQHAERLLGHGKIPTPKNVVVLALLLPATVAVDAVSFPIALTWVCLTDEVCIAAVLTVLAGVY
jgi:hypothetical protein